MGLFYFVDVHFFFYCRKRVEKIVVGLDNFVVKILPFKHSILIAQTYIVQFYNITFANQKNIATYYILQPCIFKPAGVVELLLFFHYVYNWQLLNFLRKLRITR